MKKAIRTGRIEIDSITPGGAQWVTAWVQTLELGDDNSIQSQIFRDGRLHRKVEDSLTDLITITDPVTGLSGQMSLAGLGMAVKAMMVKWMLEDNPTASYDAENDLVIVDGPDS